MCHVSPILVKLDVRTRELDEVQRMIDHVRKTYLGQHPIMRSALDRRQLLLDSQRIRIEAAKTHMINRK